MTEMLIDQSQIESAPQDAQIAVETDAPPVGVVIVGMAQSGKSTARKKIEESWIEFENTRPVLSFPLSNGYRGFTAAVIHWAGLNPGEEPEKGRYQDSLYRYLEAHESETIAQQLDGYYQNPADVSVWRSPAVNSVVSFTSGIPEVRPRVNAAALRHLRGIFTPSGRDGLSQLPGLVVLDGRNGPECMAKLAGAGVKSLGTIVLTCDEVIAAGRKLDKGAPAEVLMCEAAKLKKRNADDRARPLAGGRMTLPEDLHPAYFADEAAHVGDTATLYDLGQRLPFEPEAGMVLATDTLPLAQETLALKTALRGMLSAVGIAKEL